MNCRETVERAVEQWARDLTDESGRNRLLYYKDLKSGTLDLAEAAPRVVDRLRSGKKVQLSQLFLAPDSVDQGLMADATKRARSISRKAQENYEEKGIQTLFLGWGMATWTAQATKATPAAPVLLCPIGLHRKGSAETDYDFELTGEWALNEALLQYLANEFEVDVLSEDLMDPYGDGEQISPEEEQAIFAEFSERASHVPGFEITERLIAGNFMYKKMPMVNDIKNNLDALAGHDLIAALAGDQAAIEAVRSHSSHPVDPLLPDTLAPDDEFLILSADSSQNEAINSALHGHSFVLQGPPGTGKSQTISNLIATMMAQGKRVLFVAEKRAAIDAVVKRLTAVGLDGFVMDFHGGVLSRKKLAQSLEQSLDAIKQIPVVNSQQLHNRLQEARQELSGYTKALHQKRKPWGLSYFEVLSGLLQLETAEFSAEVKPQPVMRFSSLALVDLDEPTTQEVRRNISDWIDLSEPFRFGRSPWAGADISSQEEAKTAFEVCLGLSGELTSNWQTQNELLLSELGVSDPGSVASWGDLMAEVAELVQAVAKAEATFTLAIFSVDLDTLVQHLAPATRSAPGRLFSKLFNKQYKSAVSELESLKPGLSTRSASDLFEEVKAVWTLTRRWTELGCSGSPRVLINAFAASEAFHKMKQAVDTLAMLHPKKKLADETAEVISSLAHELLNDQHTLFQLPKLHNVEHSLREAHVGPLLDKVTQGVLSDDALETAFDHSRLRSIQHDVWREDSRLSGFQASRQSRYVGEFQQADTEHIKGNPKRVARRIAEHAVGALNKNPNQEQLIRKEARKKTRHLPLRSLFEQAPEALAALRPCWAMSPLDVAQTLPPRPLFDLVVFDEASQVLPCDAISALLRGQRVMVAGDSRQLPPTVFFDSSESDHYFDEEDETMADYESILDVMDAQLSRRRQLTWHYRSQDERLIAYSNQEIYHGSLTTFPGASSDKCLSSELVPHRMGVATTGGSNSDEVLRVVDLMIKHARTRLNETLGVIAMGIKHAQRIEEALRQRLEEESNSDLEAFFSEAKEERTFVKNLERVQGDERDAIILSIGYGKNAYGKMQYRFGPLNREGGERRLNVAITRARKRMMVVSSFSYADMDPAKTRSNGANMLRGFLKFAQSGGTELDGADAAEPLNPFEIDVLDKLTAAGLAVVPQYGCSGYRIDFAVRHPTKPGQFALAVEADGASYHSSPTARDRDRLRQEHLERLGWRFCRIWSTDWFNDHRQEVERVLGAYEQAVSEIDSGQIVPPSPSANQVEQFEVSDLNTNDVLSKLDDSSPSRGPKPFICSDGVSSMDDISHHELVTLVSWINSDGLLRTNKELFDAVFAELPFKRRGTRINAAISRAIDAATGSVESMME
ncbi:MAG: DUF4011 domain-containing protein [Acidimicrobiia bacterium]|nr:DUF4011 domain-containing protein [Acidimicrobiia bacterium]MYC57829.1 DUF4011 domain-containing protein [Acidimicrobiia bacterium]MYI30287.1 DUF4011 domain-containing protein [Acidimicrobiia bacterium]